MSDGGAQKNVYDENSVTPAEYLDKRANQLNSLSTNILSLFKINLVILGLFLPIVSNLLGGEFDPGKIFNNIYTQTGLVFWIFSVLGLLVAHHYTRQANAKQYRPMEQNISGKIPDAEFFFQARKMIQNQQHLPNRINWLTSGCALLSIIAIGFFALGVLSPYVTAQPKTYAIVILIIGSLLFLFLSVFRWVIKHGQSISEFLGRGKSWNELGQQRQKLLKAIYNNFGKESFTLSDLQDEARTIRINDENGEFHTPITDGQVSEYLLERLAEDGYFEKDASGNKKVRTPAGYDINPIEDSSHLDESIDLLATKLESNENARSIAGREIGVRPDEVLSQLSEGSPIDKIENYNRIYQRLDEAELELENLRAFEFLNSETVYQPTELVDKAFDKIERERDMKRLEREQAERREELRRDENTLRYLVQDPVNEYGDLTLVTHDISVMEDTHHSLTIPNAEVSDEVRDALEELESGDEVVLRVEWNPQIDEYYIAEAPNLP